MNYFKSGDDWDIWSMNFGKRKNESTTTQTCLFLLSENGLMKKQKQKKTFGKTKS